MIARSRREVMENLKTKQFQQSSNILRCFLIFFKKSLFSNKLLSLRETHGLCHMTLASHGFARSRDKLKSSTTTVPVATKLGRVGINEELSSINSHNPLITWSCKVTWNIRYVLLQHVLWPPKVVLLGHVKF